MANFNRVVLMGNLTRDPEFKMAGDLAICKLGMAVNRKTKDREDVTFVDLTAFGRQAELINQYLTKGSPLFIEGRLSWSSWDAADGSKRSKLEVIIENFQFMGGRPDGDAPAEEVVEAPKKVAKKAAKKVTKKATRKVTKKPVAKRRWLRPRRSRRVNPSHIKKVMDFQTFWWSGTGDARNKRAHPSDVVPVYATPVALLIQAIILALVITVWG